MGALEPFRTQRNNYLLYRSWALSGRSYNQGDRGRTVAGGGTRMYLAEGAYPDHEEHIRLVLHGTDIAHFFPERVEFTCEGWRAPTTRKRINTYTPFWVHSIDDPKCRKFMVNYDSRIFLKGGPRFGLEWEPGVQCDWEGNWIPSQDKAGEYVELSLPKAGARSRARKMANRIRKELTPHLSLLQDRRDNQLYNYEDEEFKFSMFNFHHPLHALKHKWAETGDLPTPQKKYLIDVLISVMKREQSDVKDVLHPYIDVEDFWRKESVSQPVHYTEAEALLNTRGPEWPESMS